jgi:predicted dehydrogenase
MVGCGGMAGHHARSYAELAGKAPGLALIDAVCDVDAARARAMAARLGEFQPTPAAYTEVARLLQERRPDAVDVVVPHALHHTVVVECLAAGAHVLIEKPLALTIRAGRRMLDAAARAGRTLAVAEQARRTPEARALHWAVNTAGLIGEPRLLFAQRAGFSLRAVVGTPWRHDKLVAGGGWVLDGEVHYFDLLRYVFGEVTEAYGLLRAFEPVRYVDPEQRTGAFAPTVEDAATALLTFERGALATFSWTHAAPGRPLRQTRYYGSAGSLDDEGLVRTDGAAQPMAAVRAAFEASLSEGEREAFFPRGIVDAVTIELLDFVTALRDGRPPEVDGLEGLRDMAVAEAIYESDAARRPVTTADVIEGRIDTYQRPIDEHWRLV